MPPAFISPELATLMDHPPEGEGWLHEIKLDGYRIAIRLAAGKVTMLTRGGLDWTARFTPISTAAGKLKAKTAYLESEVKPSRPCFGQSRPRSASRSKQIGRGLGALRPP